MVTFLYTVEGDPKMLCAGEGAEKIAKYENLKISIHYIDYCLMFFKL